MQVLIATPTSGNIVTTALVSSVVSATVAIHEAGGTYRQMALDGSDIVLARNYFANLVLRTPDISHLLFIDSDMLIDAAAFRRLIAAERPFAGLIYPEKKLDAARYAALLAEGTPEPRARALASRFNVRLAGPRLDLSEGFCAVEGIGFGGVLLTRGLLERLAASDAVEAIRSAKIRQEFGWDPVYDFFRPIELEDGDRLSEDYAFCARVRALGDVEIWALAGHEVGHVGMQRYTARLTDSLNPVS